MTLRTISDDICRTVNGSTPSYQLALNDICAELQKLLLEDILPVWSTVGIDFLQGGFCETIAADWSIPCGARRIRVTARQVDAFCVAAELGWNRNAAAACARHGGRFLESHSSEDGLLHHILANDGRVEGEYDLYDQAFLLLSYAHAYRLLNDEKFIQRGKALLQSVKQQFYNPAGGFIDATNGPYPLRSNPHMHLLEGALAWAEVDSGDLWRDFADELVSLFTTKFFDNARGFVRESFGSNWQPIEEDGRCRVEPGHNFEWAWLLLRWSEITGGDCGDHPHRLIDFAETYGYDSIRMVAVNEVWSDGAPSDSNARLWPQTERLKAWLSVAEVREGRARRQAEANARDAAQTLQRYLSTGAEGLWHDVMADDGRFKAGVSPASSLYHIVCALAKLARYVAHPDRNHPSAEGPSQRYALGKITSLRSEL
jgi:mannose/cellobiose epimerase-like protein (N-acyl-D-glucosamine 2-epimerase family)